MPNTSIAQGLTEKFQNYWLWAMCVGIVITVLSAAIYGYRSPYPLLGIKENLLNIGPDVFIKYLVLVTAVERAAAVFVNFFRNQNSVDWSLRIDRISEILQKTNPSIAVLKAVYAREHSLVEDLKTQGRIERPIAAVANAQETDEYVGYLTSAKHVYVFQRGRFNSLSTRYVANIVLLAGLGMAALGLSLFNDVLQTPESVPASQGTLLRLADILVTGGLLGGGSAGLNAVATKLTEILNSSSRR